MYFDMNGTFVDFGVLIELCQLVFDVFDYVNVLVMIITFGGCEVAFKDLLDVVLWWLLE